MRYGGKRRTSLDGSKQVTPKALSSARNIFRDDCFCAIITPDALLSHSSLEGSSSPGIPLRTTCEWSRDDQAARLRTGRLRGISVALCSVSFDARFGQAA